MSADTPRGSDTPAATLEFVGRRSEIERVDTLISGTARLITLVGPGGIGKTRLAAEALRRATSTPPNLVHWARLARLRRGADVGAVAEEVVQAVVRTNIAARSAWDVLVSTFTDEQTAGGTVILVLDNCEHVLASAGQLIAGLLDEVPGLIIVATSREPIGWVDEFVLTVPPLPPRRSLALLRRWAVAAGRPFTADQEQLALAEQICRHVDHNPLFIRLAAARLRQREPAEVLRELTGDIDDGRMQWSHNHTTEIEERHRGVGDVIAWSFTLCEPTEQLLLERMSIFAAGYERESEEVPGSAMELDAITAVCADDRLTPRDIETYLERLAERSLLSTHITATQVRYYLLESVRVFARNQLRQRAESEAEELASRHRRYYRDRVVAGQAIWYGPREQDWLDWARPAWDNILVAIETSLADPEEAAIGLETATVLMSMWVPFMKGAGRALTRFTENALDATRDTQPQPTALRVRATALIGWIALWQGHSVYTAELLDSCVRIYLPDTDTRTRWRDTAEEDIGLPAPVEWTWGLELMLAHQDRRAITVLARARSKYAQAGERTGHERSDLFVAFSSAFIGNHDEALDNTGSYLERAIAAGSVWSTAWAEIARAIALTKHDRAEEALQLAHTALTQHVTAGDTWTACWAVGARIVATVQLLDEQLRAGAVSATDPTTIATATDIARLVGGFKTYHRSMGIAIDRVALIATEIRRSVTVSTSILGDRDYLIAENQGAQLRPEHEELQRYVQGTLALDRLPPTEPQRRSPPSRWETLSRAERDIAVLVAAGWSNNAIAARRQASPRTVEAQIVSLRQKLMVASRNDVVWHVPDELSDRVEQESAARPERAARRAGRR